MKKIVVLIAMCIICTLQTIAEPIQEVDNNQSYFTSNVQKQPKKDNKQKIHNHFSFFVINIQINGKIDRIPDSNAR